MSLDKTRSRSRRAKALWTLYTSLAYLISALILVLVVGPQDWDLPHYAGLVGAPLLIYGVRKAITATFGWSIARQQSNVERLQKQREEKITELKKATRYDSTQELLQKYGGSPPKSKDDEQKQTPKNKSKDPQSQPFVQRTGLPPPPTANIKPRGPPVSPPGSPLPNDARPPQTPQVMLQSPVSIEEPGFAPNAFSQPPPSRAVYEHTPHWYDRILDVMLGEDENLAKNRIVLLCQSCRTVNGQAPPGVKTLEELGRWRCQNCGAWNGVQAEAAKVVRDVTAEQGAAPSLSPIIPTDEEPSEPAIHEIGSIEEQEGSTGRDNDDDGSSVSKRVTRSAGKAEVDGL